MSLLVLAPVIVQLGAGVRHWGMEEPLDYYGGGADGTSGFLETIVAYPIRPNLALGVRGDATWQSYTALYDDDFGVHATLDFTNPVFGAGAVAIYRPSSSFWIAPFAGFRFTRVDAIQHYCHEQDPCEDIQMDIYWRKFEKVAGVALGLDFAEAAPGLGFVLELHGGEGPFLAASLGMSYSFR